MRHTYIVSIDTDTGEAVAAEVPRENANMLPVAPNAPRAVECFGARKVADAAADALRAVLPEA